jgi:hypothetical protein
LHTRCQGWHHGQGPEQGRGGQASGQEMGLLLAGLQGLVSFHQVETVGGKITTAVTTAVTPTAPGRQVNGIGTAFEWWTTPTGAGGKTLYRCHTVQIGFRHPHHPHEGRGKTERCPRPPWEPQAAQGPGTGHHHKQFHHAQTIKDTTPTFFPQYFQPGLEMRLEMKISSNKKGSGFWPNPLFLFGSGGWI